MFYIQAELDFNASEISTNMSRNSDFVKRGFKSAQSSLVDIKQQAPFYFKSIAYYGVASRVTTAQQMQDYGYHGDYDTVIVIVKQDFLDISKEDKDNKSIFVTYQDSKFTIDTIQQTDKHYKIFLKQRN